ncbi:MAG: alpha/beta hydrolase [Clostridia bacterium]|nr:alpha/beta hydrolase [Clostridia bacterium]
MSCKESFYYNIQDLQNYYRVTAFDFPGFGASSPIEYGWSVADYAAFTAKFISQAGLHCPFVVAHSFGARVAIKLASQDDNIFSALVVTGGAGMVKERSAGYKRKVAAYRAVKRIAPKFAEKNFGSSEYRRLSPVMRQSYKKIVNEDLTADAAKIKCRTLLLYGEGDTVTPADEEGITFNHAICGSQLKIMCGGHFCFSEYPQAFNSSVARFFGQCKEF